MKQYIYLPGDNNRQESRIGHQGTGVNDNNYDEMKNFYFKVGKFS